MPPIAPVALPPPSAEPKLKPRWLEEMTRWAETAFGAAKGRSAALAWLRFVVFAGVVWAAYRAMARQELLGLILAIAGLAVFALVVRVHAKVRRRAALLGWLLEVSAEASRRMTNAPVITRSGARPQDIDLWRTLFDGRRSDGVADGPVSGIRTSVAPEESDAVRARSHAALSEQEIGDLDLFGEPLSLYGLLNGTSSPAGAYRLTDYLFRPLPDKPSIDRRQAAVRWLADHPVERLQLMALAAGLRGLDDPCRKLYETLRDAAPMANRTALQVVRIWGLAGPIALALGFANQVGWRGVVVGWWPLLAVLMLNVVLIQRFLRPTREHIRPWLHLDEIVARLRDFAESAGELLPEEGRLGDERQRLRDAMAPRCLPALQRRIPFLFLGLSGIMHLLIDVLVFWDLQVLWLMERCYIGHRRELLGALAALGECEALASLGSFAWEQPNVCWPEIAEGPCSLEIDGGRHPLIAPQEAVCNALQLGGDMRTWIITGSNMSGKSTFLRMAATNVILAQAGGAAAARRMRLTPMEVLTDLRIRDDLSRRESYFLAEVRQVRRMVESAAAGRCFFCLIDEPFRGTNSAERIAAATAVIQSLIDGGGLHLVATHDAALTSLGERVHAANYHFSESFHGGALVFDYILRGGPAENRNALRVLEMEGYPADLVARARQALVDSETRAAGAPRGLISPDERSR